MISAGFHNCLAEYTVHNLSPCYGLFRPTALVLLNSVARWCNTINWWNFTCLCAWASEEIFPGEPLVDFSKRFSRGGAKSGEICFLTLDTKKTAFFAEISKFLPLFWHPRLCGGKVRATPLKNWGNFKRFNTILKSVICWILYTKWNIWQINSKCAFVFTLERLNSWIGNTIGMLTDNLLDATYALSCLCIPVSNTVVEWAFSHDTSVLKMWKSCDFECV